MTSELKKMAEELLTLGAVRDAINTEYRRRHAVLQEQYRELGLERHRITTQNDVEFGTLVLASPVISVEIADTDAMLDWLDANHPDEIETITTTISTINSAYYRVLVEAAKKAGVGIDPQTNELLDWLKVTVGEKTLRATPTREAKAMVRDMIQGTGLQLQLEDE